MTETYLKTKEEQEAQEIIEFLHTLDPGTKRELMGVIQGIQMAKRIQGGTPDPDGSAKKTA